MGLIADPVPLHERESDKNILMMRTFEDPSGELAELERYASLIAKVRAKPANYCPRSPEETAPNGNCGQFVCAWCSTRKMMREEEKQGRAIYYVDRREEMISEAVRGKTPAEARHVADEMRAGYTEWGERRPLSGCPKEVAKYGDEATKRAFNATANKTAKFKEEQEERRASAATRNADPDYSSLVTELAAKEKRKSQTKVAENKPVKPVKVAPRAKNPVPGKTLSLADIAKKAKK